jgi:predicted DNA-binding ribbon-helix-helix protein
MCEIFLRGDSSRFERKSRSIRIDGHVTSVCLEGIFWDLLGFIAEDQNLKLSKFISELYHEALIKNGQVTNLSSVLRVACMNYLNHNAANQIPEEHLLSVGA